MKLKAQKFYITEGGAKIFVVGQDPGGLWVVACGGYFLQYDEGGNLVDEDYIRKVGFPEDYKIVEEWKKPKCGELWVIIFGKQGLSQSLQFTKSLHVTKAEVDTQIKGLREDGFHIFAVKRVGWTEGEFDLKIEN